jgi:hypothetical protein
MTHLRQHKPTSIAIQFYISSHCTGTGQDGIAKMNTRSIPLLECDNDSKVVVGLADA